MLDPNLTNAERRQLAGILAKGLYVDTSTEKVRQREIREGRLYDCPDGLHAQPAQSGNQTYCQGQKVGVGGVGTSACCVHCDRYLFNSEKNSHPKG